MRIASCLIPVKDLKPNVFVLTDISNEPDDAESLVRLLLYSNEILIKGIVATTSYWLNYTTHEEDIYPIIDAYEKVLPNLLLHSSEYPSADYLRSVVNKGHPVYGLNAFKEDSISKGAKSLIRAVEITPDSEKLYVLVWGGAGVLAEALKYAKDSERFTEKVIVYSISDQDDAGPWIRHSFPQLKYICSLHGFNQYSESTWVGISGEKFDDFDKGGPDSSLISKEWIKKNIMDIGPLGAVYPEPMFIMEGDTPSTLFVVPNGLNDPENPNYGGWGGRYILLDQTGRFKVYSDTHDYVVGQDNETHVSNQATIWRWRDAYQNDFAARMQWTVENFNNAVHQPVIIVNDTKSWKPLETKVEVDTEFVLDASKSYDLNNRNLTFKWYQYREVSLSQNNLGNEIKEIDIVPLNQNGSKIKFQVPSFEDACYSIFNRPLADCKHYHIILEVINDGIPTVRTYKRIIVKTMKGNNEFGDVKYKQNFTHIREQSDDVKIHDEL